MPLTPDERIRVKWHLGYPLQDLGTSMALGTPLPVEYLFVVEDCMSRITEGAIPILRQILNILDGINERLVRAQGHLAASKLGELETRENEPGLLRKEYRDWGGQLAGVLGCPFFAYGQRYAGAARSVATSG